MTFEEITKLVEMGFTPEQITMLSTSSVNPTPTEESTGSDGGESLDHPLENPPSDPPKETPPEETAPAEEKEDASKEVLAAIADLKKAVQANNIKTMSVEGVNPEAELEAAMSELIRPSLKKGE